jgi:probable F420-dependent oxidoreductase
MVELGVSLMAIRPERMPDLAVRAEELGYESVFAPDHVVFPVSFESRYPGAPDGEFPYPRDMPLYDPWISLMQIAQATKSIKLGTAVYVLALRHPVESARLISTLDHLSRGRVLVGIGGGWLQEEFTALGLDPKTRFSRMEEAVEVMRLLWTEKEAEYHGKHFDFAPLHFSPKPIAKPHPPILFGGYSDSALRRAVRLGDGWLSGGDAGGMESVAVLQRRVKQLQEELEVDRPFQITILEGRPDAAFIAGLAELGIDRLVVMPWSRTREAMEGLENFMEEARSVL